MIYLSCTIAFGFLASQEVKAAGVGNLGLHDRGCFHSQHGRGLKPLLYRALGPQLDTKVHRRVWWRSLESDDVCGLAFLCISLTSSLAFVSWGQSAGAISVGLHMLANGGDTEGLFRAAFMQSGAPTPVGDITHVREHPVAFTKLLCDLLVRVSDTMTTSLNAVIARALLIP